MGAIEKIEEQQKTLNRRSAAWMVGEQLKDLCRMDARAEELLDKDLDVPEMSIQKAEAKIRAFADQHKTGSFSCVTPIEADRILREFYGIPLETVTGADTSSGASRHLPLEGKATGDSKRKRGVVDLSRFF